EVTSPTFAPGSGSFGIVAGARLATHRDLDLAGVLELVLDAAGDVLRQPHRLLVGDFFALDHDPDLAPRLQRKRLRDALERIGNAFKAFEALDVRFQNIATCAGTGGGN